MDVAVKARAKRKHLNAQECDELQRSEDAAGPVTRRNSALGSRDPNCDLHSRSPTKRRRKGSPSGQHDFFSVTKVIGSSPHKSSAMPSTSAYRAGSGVEFDDDNKENNNVSVLAKEEKRKVEPLPDADSGLRSSKEVQLRRLQGSMRDLPEEVLWEVLSLLPAADLYRNISLVCHRWRNIVLDPRFVPFKKKYYRYMMRENETVLEVCTTLLDYNITCPAPPEDSIRNLVMIMAQHKVAECVKPDDVLSCVKKHRLFPQAEAAVRLRIHDAQEFLPFGFEGPNPYAVMAVILVLTESVDDVQALVTLLSGCMSLTSTTEYLSHMAMMLLAMERSQMKIGYRLHYNIYYVLHLLENGQFSTSSNQNGGNHLTREQQEILNHDIQDDHVVKIEAFAGTGKTTTLMRYAAQRPHLRFLYVALNNSMAAKVQQCVPPNVDCRTAHSLAFSDVGRRYQMHEKLTFNVKPFAIHLVLTPRPKGYGKAKVVTTILNTFMASADQTIGPQHVPCDYAICKGHWKIIELDEQQAFINQATDIWNKMKDVREKSKQAYYMTHDGYLKLWQLRDPKPCLTDQYDAIFIDEAQDCTPAIMDVLMAQRCGKILVGDTHQQIYTCKGGVNSLCAVDHTHIFYLTQSFRFGAQIAFVGAAILKVCKGVKKIMVGEMQKGGVCDEKAEKAVEAMKKGENCSRGKICILSRCNMGVFKVAVQLIDANQQCQIHFIGGVKKIGLERIMDIYLLMTYDGEESKRRAITDPLIQMFFSSKNDPYLTFKDYIVQTDDKELDRKLSIVEKYKDRIPELVVRLMECAEPDFHQAEFIVGTVQRARSLEFDTVIIDDDFVNIPAASHNLCHFPNFSFSKYPEDEWNLLYVAVTRAKSSLAITKTIFRILTVAGEYFLKSKITSSLMAGSDLLPCSVSDCPNSITPSSAFIMTRPRMQCSECVTNEGPLCERCVWNRIGPTAFLMNNNAISMGGIQLVPINNLYFLDIHL